MSKSLSTLLFAFLASRCKFCQRLGDVLVRGLRVAIESLAGRLQRRVRVGEQLLEALLRALQVAACGAMMLMTTTTPSELTPSEQASSVRSSCVRSSYAWSSYVLLVCERPASWLLAA